jgi:hypothetical protein
MTVSLTTRLGLHRWSVDTDPWDREHFDADNATLEDLAVIGTQGTNAARPAAGVQRRLYLATDAERVYLDDGDEWYELAVLSTVNTWTGANDFTGGLKINGSTVGTAQALTDHLNDTSDAHDASAISVIPTGDVAATDVQAAIAELAAEKATGAALTAHTGAASGAHAASAVSVVPTGDVAATDVQAAIAELAAEKATGAALTAHTGAAAGAHAATAISYAGSTDLVATTVEAALDELDAEKLAKAGGTATGLITFGAGAGLADGQDLTVGTGTGSKVGQAASKLGFFGATPVARPGTYNLTGSADRTLGAYASDPENAAYVGAAGDGEAKLTDLNALRTAYENLRVYVEDLAGVVIATATDAKTLGLVG